MDVTTPLKKVLNAINLGILSNNFIEQKTHSLETCLMLDDKPLERLCLVTIGDRARFMDAASRSQGKLTQVSLIIPD